MGRRGGKITYRREKTYRVRFLFFAGKLYRRKRRANERMRVENGETTDKLTVANGEKVFPIKAAIFVSLLIKASLIKALGYPIKDFFIWSDDIEYTTRITKKRIGPYVPGSVVTRKILSNKTPI